ncbi:MAG TPA: HK97 family phage prohead protease [Reyranella sp.]|nr:HK97 family phage prohead protease [Reyranella sp.]
MKREAPKKGEAVYRSAEITKAADKPRTITFVASDETVDRYGDIIRADGWDLTAYKKNPVMLFGHNSREPPIGTTDVEIVGKKLMAEATFLPEGVSAFADEIWRIVDAGALRAMSVGFLPTETPLPIWKDDDEETGIITGFEFVGQELLENSVVPVPANPSALALARSVASPPTIRRLFIDDARASAHVAAESRRRSIQLARLRAG